MQILRTIMFYLLSVLRWPIQVMGRALVGICLLGGLAGLFLHFATGAQSEDGLQFSLFSIVAAFVVAVLRHLYDEILIRVYPTNSKMEMTDGGRN